MKEAAAETGGKKTKKKKATKKAAKKKAVKKVQKMKGGFGVFLQQDMYSTLSADSKSTEPTLVQVASDLKDTLDAERWIRENAEDYKEQTLVIAQVKKSVTVKVETQVKVTFE